MKKQWEIIPTPVECIENLVFRCNLSPLLARLLVNRDITTPEAVEIYFNSSLKDLPDPFLMKNMELAIQRVQKAFKNSERIVIYGDYDVDGTTATSMLMLFFKELGYPVDYYIPHRMREGYSLNIQALKKLKEEGVDVVMTVDNGISSSKEADAAKSLGIDLIITDHHLIPEKLPEAYAILNPHQRDCAYPDKRICGTGVAFNFMMALRQRLREEGFFEQRPEPNLLKYLDLVALATVADVVPLRGVNRIFVKYGLKQMKKTAWAGLMALKEVAQVSEQIDADHLGFRLGPRINACGRLYDASAGVQLLTSDDMTKARNLAMELDRANSERRQVEEGILKEAVTLIEKPGENMSGCVLYQPHWHPGVVGIVATRLVEKFAKPFVLLGNDGDHLKGSARTYGDIHLLDLLQECAHLLIKCGGHKAAAGLSLHADQLENFRSLFSEKVAQRMVRQESIPLLPIDAEITLNEVGPSLFADFQRMQPFGQGNKKPVLCLRKISTQNPRIVGERHLKFSLKSSSSTYDVMAFRQAHLVPLLSQSGQINLAFSLLENFFNGIKYFNLEAIDICN